jgi:hypothetical protein
VFLFIRRYLFAVATVLGLGFAQPANAANILVFGDGFGSNAANELEATLTGLGHTVVNLGVTRPLTDPDFIGIDTAWHVGSSASYFSSSRNPLRNFLLAGGGLHLSGENSAFNSANSEMLNSLVNDFIFGPGLSAGGTATSIVTVATGLPSNIADILSVPNNIAGVPVGAFAMGELLGVEAGNIFASNGTEVVGVVYGAGDLIVPEARLSIMMDVNWFSGSFAFDDAIVENLQVFLEGGATVVAMPEPGTALLLVTAGFLGVACRRRKRT